MPREHERARQIRFRSTAHREARAADPVLAADISRLRSGLLLPQNPDDLFFRKPTCLHIHPLPRRWTLSIFGGNLGAQVNFA
jgi:hypothetical protein